MLQNPEADWRGLPGYYATDEANLEHDLEATIWLSDPCTSIMIPVRRD